jgi:RNA polymerase sigma-70 factor (ECF subfamily)
MRRCAEEFERIMLPHARSLLRFALRLTNDRFSAEDLVQETLLLAWRGFPQFQPGTNARAWLFRILLNLFHGQHRKAKLSSAEASARPEAQAPAPGIDGIAVFQALNRLGVEQRTALLLAAVEGFTCREIADILAVPVGTVMSRLSRAREAMREALASGGRPYREGIVR